MKTHSLTPERHPPLVDAPAELVKSFQTAAVRDEELVSVAGGVAKPRASTKCVACSKLISGPVAYAVAAPPPPPGVATAPADDADAPLYCESCRTSKLGPLCRGCGKPAPRSEAVVALNSHYHRACLRCDEPDCGKRLPEEYYEWQGGLRCREHYLAHAAERCAKCEKPVDGGLRALGRAWHEECLTCKVSGDVLGEGSFYLHEGGTLSAASLRKTAPLCKVCCEPALTSRVFALGGVYHQSCFRCSDCHAEIGERRFVLHDGEPYLEGCYQKLFGALSGKEQQRLVHGETQGYAVHVPLSMQLGSSGLDNFAQKHADLFPQVKRLLREQGVTAMQAYLFQPPFVTKPCLTLTLTLPVSLEPREELPELLRKERLCQQWEQLIAGVHDVNASKGNPWWATIVPELSAPAFG